LMKTDPRHKNASVYLSIHTISNRDPDHGS